MLRPAESNGILKQLDGKDHLETRRAKVPSIFGMNFRAVSVGQKLIANGVKVGSTDAHGTPTASGTNGTLPAPLIATALPGYIPDSEPPLNPNGIGPGEDDISLLWLAPGSDTRKAVDLLETNSTKIGLGQIYYGTSFISTIDARGSAAEGRFPDSGHPRAAHCRCDLHQQHQKQSEHGGFAYDDTNVMQLVSEPAFRPITKT